MPDAAERYETAETNWLVLVTTVAAPRAGGGHYGKSVGVEVVFGVGVVGGGVHNHRQVGACVGGVVFCDGRVICCPDRDRRRCCAGPRGAVGGGHGQHMGACGQLAGVDHRDAAGGHSAVDVA